MAKTNDETRKDEVRSAILSLRDIHCMPSRSGCQGVRTAKTVAIEKQIEARKKQLESDPKLVKLRGELATERKLTLDQAKKANEQIDTLLRRLNLRGVTEDLLKDIEKLAAATPVKLLGHDCE